MSPGGWRSETGQRSLQLGLWAGASRCCVTGSLSRWPAASSSSGGKDGVRGGGQAGVLPIRDLRKEAAVGLRGVIEG